MPPIPLPPSDNLYKFVAISGLLLVLTTIVLYVTIDLEVRARWSTGITVVETRADLADARLKKAIGPPSKLSATEAEQWKQAVASKISQLTTRLHQLEKTGTEVDDYWTSIYKAKVLGPFLISGCVVGAVLMAGGFYFWYFRLQRYQDRILKRQADSQHDSSEV